MSKREATVVLKTYSKWAFVSDTKENQFRAKNSGEKFRIFLEGRQKEWWAGPDSNRGSLGFLRARATPSGDPNQESFLAIVTNDGL